LVRRTEGQAALSPSRTLEVADMGPLDWFEYAEARGWGDGLPTLPPTEAAVDALLAAADEAVAGEIGPIPPAGVMADMRSLAANAVMAGCTTTGFLIAVAALEAVLDERFNAVGVMATTHPCTPLVLVSGSASTAANVNPNDNCLGQGCRANATIGRALHLMLVNLGGSRPGTLDRATHGSPAKYSYCFAEQEESSPWEPLAVRRGSARGDPVVTVFAAEGPHNVNDHGSTSGDELIVTMAGVMATPGSNNLYLGGDHLVVWGPEHAATLARDGWDVPAVQKALHERAAVPESTVSAGKRAEFAALGLEPEAGFYRIAGGPDNIQIAVAGGRGKHSVWIPTFGSSRCVSRPVRLASGTTPAGASGGR
jgi:hypothetical protein